MTFKLDLRKLAEMSARHRAFLSIYLSEPRSAKQLDRRFRTLRRMLSDNPHASAEAEHFDRNVDAVKAHLEKNRPTGPTCILSAWASDFLQAIPLPAPTDDVVRIGSSPYIRPLAELQEEYESVAVVVADNRVARVYLVSAEKAGDAARRRAG